MQTISNRIKEIRRQIESGDYNLATRRILDLFLDFYISRKWKIEAVALRAEYNMNIVAKELTGEQSQSASDWATRVLTLLDNIEAELITPEEETEYPSQEVTQAPVYKASCPSDGLSGEKEVFRAERITKRFNNPSYTFELPPVDLVLKLGEITGIVGENGNGKTTLLRMIAGDLEAESGHLSYPLFGGVPVNWYDFRTQIAYIPQHVARWHGYLKDNLHFTAALHGIKGDENEEQVNFILHRLGLSKYENATWSEISGGYKLRFELAKALVWRPKLLIIDEPLAHLDINAQQLFLQDLRFLTNSVQYPMAVFISSQHLHEIESVSDNILFIKNGQLLYNGKMKSFGTERNENVFELITEKGTHELESILAEFEGVKVADIGHIKIIHAPLTLTSAKFLAILGEKETEVQYFRDISTSTSKLFKETITLNR